MADLGELVALAARNLLPLADVPRRPVVRVGGHDLVGVQVQGVALQPEDAGLRRRRWILAGRAASAASAAGESLPPPAGFAFRPLGAGQGLVLDWVDVED